MRVNGNGGVELGKGGMRGSMWDEVSGRWELWLKGQVRLRFGSWMEGGGVSTGEGRRQRLRGQDGHVFH